MIIRDILGLKDSTIFSIAPEGLLSDAVKTMVSNDIGSLVVMKNGAMVGMLTFREVLSELNVRGGNLGDAQVGTVMVRKPITGNPTDSVDHLREVMLTNHIRYLPVAEGEQLLGVISFHDVAKAVIKQTNFENRLLKRYIKNWPEDDEKK
jgi:predicted transcriptional regulator